MNPQLNKIFSKLAKEDKKTELASEKVELNIAKDIASLSKEGQKKRTASMKAQDKILSKIDEYNDALSKVDDLKKEIPSYIKQAKSKVDQAEKLAKDLGVDVNNIKGYRDIKADVDFFTRALNSFKTYKKL